MKAFTDFMKSIPEKYVPRVEDAISDACRVLGDPNASAQAYDAVQRKLTDIQLKVGLDSARAMKDEIEERLMARFKTAGDAGLIEKEVISSRLHDFYKLVGKTRHTIGPTLGDTIRNLIHWDELKRIPGGQLILFGGFAIAAVAVTGSINGGREVVGEVQRAHDNLTLALQYRANVRDFVNDLRSSLPPPPMPSAVAAVSNTAVAAEIREPNGETHVIRTTIGGVYQALPPEQRQRMESDIGSAEHSGTGIHGTINVTAPFEGSPTASLHF